MYFIATATKKIIVGFSEISFKRLIDEIHYMYFDQIQLLQMF